MIIQARKRINLQDVTTDGGDIRLRAEETITTGDLSTLSETGEGGEVELEANGDITTGDITTTAF